MALRRSGDKPLSEPVLTQLSEPVLTQFIWRIYADWGGGGGGGGGGLISNPIPMQILESYPKGQYHCSFFIA